MATAPQKTPAVIESIFNPSEAACEGRPAGYELVVNMDVLPPGGGVLKAVMLANAECMPVEGNLGRMSVKFDGGCLQPANGEPTDAWLETFSDLPSKIASNADLTRPERFQLWVAKRLFGLSRGAADGVQEYKMPKSPEGYLDILFLDEELRVTRGNRGSIVIAERCAVP